MQLKTCCNGTIYCFTSKINGKKYIGQTVNFNRRLVSHRTLLKNNRHFNSYLQFHFNKYNVNKDFYSVFEINIIEDKIQKDLLNEKEQYYVEFYNCMDYKKGFNLRAGGNACKFSKSLLRKLKEVHRNRQSPVYMYDLDGNHLGTFRSIADASEKIGIPQTNISRSILKKEKCRNVFFRREFIENEPFKRKGSRPLYVYTLNGELVGEYRDLKHISDSLSLNYNAVNNAHQRGIKYKNYLIYSEKKEFTKYVPNICAKIVYIEVKDNITGELVDKVKGLKACAEKYKINPNTLNTYCNRSIKTKYGFTFKKSDN